MSLYCSKCGCKSCRCCSHCGNPVCSCPKQESYWTDSFDTKPAPSSDSHMPTAAEMAARTKEKIDKEVRVILKKVIDKMEESLGFSAKIPLTEREEKMVSVLIERLDTLGYKCEYDKGYYEDIPCGSHIPGSITVSWKQ